MSGLIALACGVVVFIAPPPSVISEITQPWLIATWGVCLFLGGLGSAAGRLSGVWLIETTGLVFLATGISVYFAVVSSLIADDLGIAVASGLIFLGAINAVRRYVELQMFTAERGRGVMAYLRDILALRTARPVLARNAPSGRL